MATLRLTQIAEVLKSVKPGNGMYEGAQEYRDQWNDMVKAFGEMMTNGHVAKNHKTVRETFYKLCDADPTNCRI